MITSKVSYDQMYPEVNPVSKNADTDSPKAKSPKNTNDAKAEATASVKINNSLFEFAIPQSAHSAVNRIAAIVRGADRAMLEIENQIDHMKDRLIKHVKNFPPFLPGSEERVQLMKRFSTFRKQIDQITFPPDNYGAMKIMADLLRKGRTTPEVMKIIAEKEGRIQSKSKKIGRNDPCFCGSGLKYKKCHGQQV